MNTILRNAVVLAGVVITTQAAAQVTFYEREGFSGQSFTTDGQIGNFARYGFNDRASSVVVRRNLWEVCEDARFSGRCVVLRPGNYPSLAAMGLNNRVSSVRAASDNARRDGNHAYKRSPVSGYDDHRRYDRYDVRGNDNPYLPAPVAAYGYHRRHNERLFEANVTSVHAVVGPPEQRCWIEHKEVVEKRNKVPGAIVGALIGGILGHQIGGGSGKDIATAGGAVVGAAVGANMGRGGQQTSTQEVQHCTSVPSQAQPEFWDVTYSFQGQEHRMQVTEPPGSTVTVNWQGEPRG